MIEFLDWWSASGWRTLVGLIILVGLWVLVYDGLEMYCSRRKGKD